MGNWSGTTVERKEGRLYYQDQECLVVDLPGAYSLAAYSLDERIASHFLVFEKPDIILAIIDACNLERNLYLVVQLLEMGQKVILVLNMMDIVKKRGIEIKTDDLSRILGIPVIETVASHGDGITAIKDAIAKNADGEKKSLFIDYGSLEEHIQCVANFLEKYEKPFDMNNRALAIKILDNDEDILAAIEAKPFFFDLMNICHDIHGKIVADIGNTLMESRYAFVNGITKECVRHHMTLEERLTLSDKIDTVVTNRFLGIPLFLGFMYLLFSLVFKIGQPMVKFIASVFSHLGEQTGHWIIHQGGPEWLSSLVSDGIFTGVGNVIAFVPYIALLFMGISILEDSGYLARAALVMDKVMHTFGLHGKSFIPMLIGFGCSVPGIMATRTLNSEKDRILTILVLPLMSCAARLPVYTLFAGALFNQFQSLVVFSLYLLGIVLAILMARLFQGTILKGETIPLVIELPPYRLPTIKNIIIHMWMRSWLFIKKAGSLIFLSVIVIWSLASLPYGVEYASETSYIGRLGQMIAPVLKPAGFGSWQAAVSLISGVFAKEAVIGTLATLYGVGKEGLSAALGEHFTPLSGFAFLIMTLIYIPCVATIVTIRNETNWKWAIFSVVYTLLLGWLMSVMVFQGGRLLGL